MTKNIYLPASLIAGTVFSAVLAGCVTTGSSEGRGCRGYQTGQTQTTVVYQDDYDYYPGYEVYYSRNRHEYVYRDGNAWVRRPEPRGVTLNVLLSTPSVRVDFHDSPELHHSSVVQSYPKNWKQAGKAHDKENDRRDDKKSDKKDEERKDDGKRP
jgi:hypothetical protein